MIKTDKSAMSFAAIVGTVLLGLFVSATFLLSEEKKPAEINVRCIGDHLLFESERTGDIQVIPNKCKKTYPRKSKQAPEGVYV